jgi:hypothetical protein
MSIIQQQEELQRELLYCQMDITCKIIKSSSSDNQLPIGLKLEIDQELLDYANKFSYNQNHINF